MPLYQPIKLAVSYSSTNGWGGFHEWQPGYSAVMATEKSTRTWRIGGLLVGLVALVFGVMALTSLLPSLNPFKTQEVDRSGPVLLQSIRDLSQYHAAVGEFQVVVDLEKDVKFVPSFLAGQRALFVAAGSVNSYVDFSGMTGDALKVSQENKTVEVTLPAAKLDKPNLDQNRSYLFAQSRGIWDRLTSLFETPNQQEFYVVGEQKIADAATRAGLTKRAEANTRTMLTGLLKSLGFTAVFTGQTAS
jgi:uncharacterized protein DUF4230